MALSAKKTIQHIDDLITKFASRKLFAVCSFFLLGFIIYSNTLNSPFIFDDKVNISGNYLIGNVDALIETKGLFKPRIIGYLTFALNYQVFGLKVWGYHLTNILIHITTTILVWRLILVTFQTPILQNTKIFKHKKYIALFAALIFLTHPIQTQAVSYTVQRFASLSTLFYVATVYLWAKARISKIIYYFYGAITTMFFGFLTKETTLTIPLIILVYDFYFFTDYKRFLKTKYVIYLAASMALLGKIILSMISYRDAIAPKKTLLGEAISNVDYFITQGSVFTKYIKLLIFPINQSVDHAHPIFHNVLDPNIIAGFLLVIFMFTLAVLTFKKFRILSFSIIWFLATLIPESSIFPIRDVMVEHRMYLPMVGFSVLCVTSAYYLLANRTGKQWCYIFVFLTLIYSILTFQRNNVWSSGISLWSDVVNQYPENQRANTNLGSAYFKSNDIEKAEYFTDKVLQLNPNNPDALNNKGAIYGSRDQFDEAFLMFEKAINLYPNYSGAYINKAALYYKQEKYEEAVEVYKIIIEKDPYSATTYGILGYLLTILGKDEEAQLYIEKGIKIDPKLRSVQLKLEFMKQNRKE